MASKWRPNCVHGKVWGDTTAGTAELYPGWVPYHKVDFGAPNPSKAMAHFNERMHEERMKLRGGKRRKKIEENEE